MSLKNIYEKSRLAPTNLNIKDDYYVLGDRYTRNLLVVGLPTDFDLGMLSLYCSNQNVKLFMITERHRVNITKALRIELKSKRKAYKETRDDSEAKRLEIEINSLRDFIDEIAYSHDKSHNVTMVYSIAANTKKELDQEVSDFKESLLQEGFKTVTLHSVQAELMKNTTPLFMDDDIPTVMKENYGVVTPSTSVAGLFPYTFQTLKDTHGFLYGRELNQSGIVMFNPLLYHEDRKTAIADGRLNNNIVVFGGSGSGKTTDVGLIVRHAIREKWRIVWLDPENKNRYLTEKYNGKYIRWGTRNARINIFDLKPISSEEGEDVDPYDTELAIYAAIHEFKTVLTLYKKEVTESMLDIVDRIIIKMYERKGITFDKSFKELKSTDFPIVQDLIDEIELRIEEIKDDESYRVDYDTLRELLRKLDSMVTTDRFYFNGHTTFNIEDVKNGMLSFGAKTFAEKASGLSDAMNFIMFRYAWSLCLDDTIPSIFIIDEAHHFLLKGRNAEEVATFYRRSRKYTNITVIATQEPEELDSDVMIEGVALRVHGKAILNNSCYKIIKKLNHGAVTSLSHLMELNPTEQERIKAFGQGDSLFAYGDRRILMTTIATEKELSAIQNEY